MGQSLPFLVKPPPFNLAPLLSILGFLGTGRRKAKGGGGGGYLAFRPILAGGQEGQVAGKGGAPLGAPPTTRRACAYSPRTRRRPRRPSSGQGRCTPGGGAPTAGRACAFSPRTRRRPRKPRSGQGRCTLRLLVSYLARPWPSSAQAKKVKISQGFHSLGAGDQERSYFGAIRLVSSSIDYEPPSRTLSRSGDHGQVCSALSPHDTTRHAGARPLQKRGKRKLQMCRVVGVKQRPSAEVQSGTRSSGALSPAPPRHAERRAAARSVKQSAA